jgi:hypothetical protein
MHFCILDSNRYKLIIGVDVLTKLKFVYDGRERRLHLEHKNIPFSLPLASRMYAFNAPAVREYLAAADQTVDNRVNSIEVDCNEEELDSAMATGVENLHENWLSCASRASLDTEPTLVPLLYLAEIARREEVP